MAGVAAVTLLAAMALAVQVGHAALVTYDFRVSHGFKAPDCSTKAIYLVNGQYPGPDIIVTQGDRLRITVHNDLFSDGLTIHWHGIFQTGTPYMDGVPMGTQCPISPGEEFVYEFTVNQIGTFWYHSHYSLQKANGLYGLFVIKPNSPRIPETKLLGYDTELKPILLNDWWHAQPVIQELGLKQQLPSPFVWVGDPQSLLFNGKGVFNCSAAIAPDCLTCNASNADCGYQVFEVEYGKRYRLRLVNAASLSYLSFAIQGHNVTVVQADGTYTVPVQFENLDINAGQTYSVVFTANQPIDNYWITTHIRHRITGPTGAAILRYKGAPIAYPTSAIPSTFPAWNDTAYSINQQRQILTRKGYTEKIPEKTREIILVGTQNRYNGYLVWAMNNNSYVGSGSPTLLEQYYGINPITDDLSYDKPKVTWNYTNPLLAEGVSIYANSKSIIYKTPLKAVIQVVFQNALALNNVSEQHPWHLHGHDAYVLGWGNGVYDPIESPKTFNLKNPIKRNTYTIYPKGWLAIRYVADNPGFWLLHCHIVFHQVMGMQVAIGEGLDQLPKLPRNFPTCGSITSDVIKKGYPTKKGRHPPGVGRHPPGVGGHA